MKKIVILIVVLSCFCTNPEAYHERLVIVNVYQEDERANDGVVEKYWVTVLKTDDGSRFKSLGKYGAVGDTLCSMSAHYYSNGFYVLHMERSEGVDE